METPFQIAQHGRTSSSFFLSNTTNLGSVPYPILSDQLLGLGEFNAAISIGFETCQTETTILRQCGDVTTNPVRLKRGKE
jgi:hypothetical protein